MNAFVAVHPPVGRLRALIAKPGLDGHDRGARVISRLFRDSGFEVIYTGLRQSPTAIARAAVAEDVDVIGLSILSGTHLDLTRRVVEELRAAGGTNIDVVIGGTVPRSDVAILEGFGVAAVFGIGTNLEDVRRWIAEYKFISTSAQPEEKS